MSLKTLWIDPVDACNLNCIMCGFKKQHTGRNRINLTDLLHLLEEAKEIGVRNLNFGTTIEPTLYRGLPRIINKSKEMGFNISLITSLSFIKPEAGLFKAFTLIDNLFISIDAATKKTYRAVRQGADWSVLMRNLKELGRFFRGEHVAARFAIQKKNINELCDFVDFVSSFGFFREIVFDPVNINPINKNYASVAWDYDDLLLCEDKLNLAYIKAKEYGLECKQYLTVDAIKKNKDLLFKKGYVYFLEGCFRYLFDRRFPKNNPCNFLRSNLFVSPKKQVFPCSGAYRENELMLGDLNQSSLKEIWGSELTNKLKEELAQGIRQGVCRQSCSTFEGQMHISGN
jgi:MoaA/NifB/PqqE/SkfB family radical SAM enzyme